MAYYNILGYRFFHDSCFVYKLCTSAEGDVQIRNDFDLQNYTKNLGMSFRWKILLKKIRISILYGIGSRIKSKRPTMKAIYGFFISNTSK